jgi:hypothetical protein
MRIELANQYAAFQIPAEAKTKLKENKLSLSAAKMVFFSDEVGLSNDDIDNFMSLKPARMEDESFEDYKNRRKFQKDLVKRRTLIYDYSVYETN